jgi:hypothetical protein
MTKVQKDQLEEIRERLWSVLPDERKQSLKEEICRSLDMVEQYHRARMKAVGDLLPDSQYLWKPGFLRDQLIKLVRPMSVPEEETSD